ncbi:MAG: hypothetical protein ORN20_00050 [Candidatus Nanopelagicales bacterium]|nr:hypothetical protein [Candidatus Nanopelagicales bacterium]
MDKVEVAEHRYAVATHALMTVMLIGVFSNLAIFAITAFTDLSSTGQTYWTVLVCLLEFIFLFGVIGFSMDISMYIKDLADDTSHWAKAARSQPMIVTVLIFAVVIIGMAVFQVLFIHL